MTQFPSTVKALTYSKTGDVDVLEKTEQPFPQQGPKDVILKVRPTRSEPTVSGNLPVCYCGCRSSTLGLTSSTRISGVDSTPCPSPQS